MAKDDHGHAEEPGKSPGGVSPIRPMRAPRVLISAGDLNAAAQRLAAVLKWTMDADGRVVPGLGTPEADIAAASAVIMGFIGARHRAVVEITERPNPLGPLHRGVM